jgi:transposase InsO family protein
VGSIPKVAKDLDLTETALREWVKQAAIDAGSGPDGALTSAELEVLRRLRRENKRLEMERDFLKKRPVAPNHLDRAFQADSSDSAWCADITFIAMASGWVYLAAIIDIGTRLIVGWSMADHMRSSLVEDALRNALAWRSPAAKLMHYSDRGAQYASESYQALLSVNGIDCSMSRAGNCYDNAVIESFFGSFKQEWVHHQRWQRLEDARAGTHDYIEVFYNRRRLHSSIGYSTLAEADLAVA